MTFTLEAWSRAFIPAMAKYADNRKIAENLRDGYPHPYTRTNAEAYVNGCMEFGETEQLCRAIVTGGEAVGSIGVFLRENREAELGYWLGEPFWGRGIMTEAVKQICEEAFSRFAIDRVFATPYAHNKGSCRVLEKAGFRFGGLTESCGCSRGQVCLYTLAGPSDAAGI